MRSQLVTSADGRMQLDHSRRLHSVHSMRRRSRHRLSESLGLNTITTLDTTLLPTLRPRTSARLAAAALSCPVFRINGVVGRSVGQSVRRASHNRGLSHDYPPVNRP